MSREDRREAIYHDEVDRQELIKTLAEACLKTGWQIHAFCLMGNHFHLVVETPSASLSAGMHWFLSAYTIRLNHRHKLSGHGFSGRFKAMLVEPGEGYLKTACDYVHLNPVRAGLLGADERLRRYPWSSFPWYLSSPRAKTMTFENNVEGRRPSLSAAIASYDSGGAEACEKIAHCCARGWARFGRAARFPDACSLLFVILFLLLFLPPKTFAAEPPNIVFVLTDDMGYSDPNCYGGNFAPTPNIDGLAKEGVRFTHFYDNAPICSPSRAAFITGMFPARWNFTTYLDKRAMNEDCEQADFLPTNAPAIARVLKAAGYETAHFGKWHLGGGRDVTNAPPFSAYGYDEHVGTYESPEPDPNITATNWIWSPQDPVKRWERTGYFVDHALNFLHRHSGQPCYVEIWPDDVHTPWVPNEEREKVAPNSWLKPDFCKVLAEYDVQMGRLFSGLKALGLDSNTLVIFTSDNGPLPCFNHTRTGGLRGSKLSLYEGGVRVPFIVRWPGHTIAGRVDEQSVLEAVDLFPTLCAIAHAPMPAGFSFDGEDMSLALDSRTFVPTKTIYWEYGRKSKFFNYPGPVYDRSPHLAVREGKWKLLVDADGLDSQLYDLAADPNEATNAADQNPDLAKRLTDDALKWKRSLPGFPPGKR